MPTISNETLKAVVLARLHALVRQSSPMRV
jgi:hypothetical protein